MEAARRKPADRSAGWDGVQRAAGPVASAPGFLLREVSIWKPPGGSRRTEVPVRAASSVLHVRSLPLPASCSGEVSIWKPPGGSRRTEVLVRAASSVLHVRSLPLPASCLGGFRFGSRPAEAGGQKCWLGRRPACCTSGRFRSRLPVWGDFDLEAARRKPADRSAGGGGVQRAARPVASAPGFLLRGGFDLEAARRKPADRSAG